MKKSRMLAILCVMTLLCGTLTACGNTEGGEIKDTETVSSEVVQTEQEEIIYVEMEACFQVANASDTDNTLVDGETLDWTKWERLETKVHLSESIDIYSEVKGKIGYTKKDIEAVYVSSNGEWSQLAIGESGYSVYVRTEELSSAIGEAVYEEGTDELNSAIQDTPSTQPGDTQDVPATNIVYPPGDYSPGSVYGPKLTQQELNEVAQAVYVFLATYDIASMDDYTKVLVAHDYLCNRVNYAASWAQNRANTAWGALVYGEAQCSGYARAMKALCDAMGVGCYYVHADDYASNPSHQWNVVAVNGIWYIVDVQCNDSSGWKAAFLVSDYTYVAMSGMSWDRSSVPACLYDYGY